MWAPRCVCGLVFLLPIVLIVMIIAVQFEEAVGTEIFVLDVLYDVNGITRTEQVAGMILIVLYQQDY